MYEHPEELYQTWYCIGYANQHPKATYKLEWDDSDAYEVVFDSAWESENGGELDIEEDDPRYDEFEQCSYLITKIIRDGAHRYQRSVTIDYRDFPDRITDLTNGVQVYPNAQTPTK